MVELIAKTNPKQSLTTHTTKVIDNCKQYANIFNLNESLRKRLILACALHDIGKATKSFQEYIRGKRERSYPHALASFPFVVIVEKEIYDLPLIASFAVLSHHTPFTVRSFQKYMDIPVEYLNNEIYDFLIKIQNVLGKEIVSIVKKYEYLWMEKPPYVFLNMLKKDKRYKLLEYIWNFAAIKTLLNLSDWCASMEEGRSFQLMLESTYGKEIYEKMKLSGLKLRDFQKEAYDTENANIFLKAPTGSGKTEGLLLWSKNRRLIYLLPTQTTVNSMWNRMKKIFGSSIVGISHGRSQIVIKKDDEFMDEKDDWQLTTEILINSIFGKPVVVATLDQYLLSALHGRHWENKIFLTKYSDIIIDEIHSYDGYVLGLTLAALKSYPPTQIAFASATFPKKLSDLICEKLGVHKEILAGLKWWERKRYRLHLYNDYIFSKINNIVEDANEGKNVMVIVNNIEDAQNLYNSLKYEKKLLLHSRFTYGDREKKENFLNDFKGFTSMDYKGYILVATQVVEVSLDISFDTMYSEIAPIDALVQRFGRVNRWGEKKSADIHIFSKYSERSERVYGKEVLDLSSKILYRTIKKSGYAPSEREVVSLVDELYEYLFKTDSFKNDFEEGYEKVDEFKNILGIQTIDLDDENMRRKFFTRLSTYIKVDVIPWKYREKAREIMSSEEKWKIMDLMVPIPLWWIKNIGIDLITPSIISAEIEYNTNIGAKLPKNII